MTDHLYLSPNAKLETEIPFFVVYETEDPGGKVAKEIKGILSSPKLSDRYEFDLIPQGPGADENSIRFMGEVSLVDPGKYEVTVAGQRQSFEIFRRADNLSFLSEFGFFYGGTAILLVIIFCWAMVSKKKRGLKTV
jgi:hypothetical protein